MRAKYAGVALGILLAAAPGLSLAQQGKSTTEVIIRAAARRKPADTPPALDLYAAPPRIRQIALSPGGGQVAFVTRADNMNLLLVYRFADRKESFVKLKDGEISTLSWADEGHVLLTASRSGLRGTCTGASHRQDSHQTADEAQSAAKAQAQQAAQMQPGGGMQAQAQGQLEQAAAAMDLDSNQPPGCVYFGVREENAVTLVDVAKASGETLGLHMGDAPNMPLGVPQIVTVDGKRLLMGGFMEMRAQGAGSQPAQRVYLWRVDPATGVGKLVDDGGGDLDRENRYVDDWLFDKAGNLKARSVYEFTREQYRIEIRDGNGWRPVLKRAIVAHDRTFAPALVGLAADGRQIVILDSDTHGKDARGAARHFHYYALSPDGALSAPLDPGDASQNQPIFSPATGRLAGFASPAEETAYAISDPQLARLYSLAKDAAPSQSVHVVSVADDPHRMLIHAEGREDTGSYYVVDFAAGTSITIGEDYPKVPTDWIASQEQISYRAGDGTEIQALITLPPKPEAKNLPLVVLPHDGPQAHDAIGFDWLAQALATRGYLVLQPNYRGSDGHGVDFMAAGFGEWNGKMLSDMADGVKNVVAQGLADGHRVCYVGFGYGGYAALKAAGQPDIRCAVSIGGISNVPAYMNWKDAVAAMPDTDEFAGLIPDPHAPRGFTPDPGSRRTLRGYIGAAANDTIAAASLHAPVLLIHAKDDAVVPPSQSRQLRDAGQAAGVPLTYVELESGGHEPSTEAARLSVLQAVTDFLARQNPAQN